MDYLVTDAEVDRERIVVTGHSRLGKAALLAAALDERIALAIPHQAGCGGSAPSRSTIIPAAAARPASGRARGKPAETVKQNNDAFPHWFNARFKEFNDHPDRLPFDQHCLVALCAPRPVLFTNGRDDTWINPEGQFEVLRAAAPVYRLLNAGDFAATNLPPDGQLIDSALGYFLRPGGHSLRPEDWKAFLDFADKHLGSPTKPRPKLALAVTGATTPRGAPEAKAATVEVARWEMHEFELHGPCHVGNPFRDAALIGEFISPLGRTNRMSGFYDGLFLWTLANEYETHPDGAYRLDNPSDVDWAKATARQVKELDPYDHLVTVHPVISSSTRAVSNRDPIDLPWRIGGFFGDGDAFDVLSQQTGQSGKGVTWDERLQCWMGDDPELVTSLRADRRFQKPVLNTENGYEYLRGHPTERKQVHHTDKVRRSAWRIVCAGGYFAAGSWFNRCQLWPPSCVS